MFGGAPVSLGIVAVLRAMLRRRKPVVDVYSGTETDSARLVQYPTPSLSEIGDPA
jgi:hypothetical protein